MSNRERVGRVLEALKQGLGPFVLREFRTTYTQNGYLNEMDAALADEYREYCQQMRTAAVSIVEAVEQDNYEKARKAAGEVKNSCTVCHEIYRS